MSNEWVSALAALGGSLVGGMTSVLTTWFAQSAQTKRDFIGVEIRKREALYGEFIAECSKLYLDSLDHALDSPEGMMTVVTVLNRIRLVSSSPVVEAAEQALHDILRNYVSEKMTMEELRVQLKEGTFNMHSPLSAFSMAARIELQSVHLHIHKSL